MKIPLRSAWTSRCTGHVNFHPSFFLLFLDPDCWGMLINPSAHPRGHGVRSGQRRHPENGHCECKGTSAACASQKAVPSEPPVALGSLGTQLKVKCSHDRPSVDGTQPRNCGVSLLAATNRTRSIEKCSQEVSRISLKFVHFFHPSFLLLLKSCRLEFFLELSRAVKSL